MRGTRLLRRYGLFGFAGLLLGCGMVLAGAAQPAQAAPSTDTCILGYVWREAVPGDHVCVTPDERQQAAFDNSQAPSRVDPNGAYGPDTCIQGYVWRQVVQTDHVCVTRATMLAAIAANNAAPTFAIGNPVVLSGQLTTPGGDAVGGTFTLTLYGDGEYDFAGHLQDTSLVAGYDTTSVVTVQVVEGGTLFSFIDQGHVNGSFFGSTDHYFHYTGTNATIQTQWRFIKQGGVKMKPFFDASFDLGGLIDEVKKIYGTISGIVAVVGPLLS